MAHRAAIDTFNTFSGPFEQGGEVVVAENLVRNTGSEDGWVWVQFALLNNDGSIRQGICRQGGNLSPGETGGAECGLGSGGFRATTTPQQLSWELPPERTVAFGFRTWSTHEDRPPFPAPSAPNTDRAASFAMGETAATERSKSTLVGVIGTMAGAAAAALRSVR